MDYFTGLSLLDEDLDGIRQLLLQLFSENEKTIDSTEFAKALILQNIVGTVLKQVQVGVYVKITACSNF